MRVPSVVASRSRSLVDEAQGSALVAAYHLHRRRIGPGRGRDADAEPADEAHQPAHRDVALPLLDHRQEGRGDPGALGDVREREAAPSPQLPQPRADPPSAERDRARRPCAPPSPTRGSTLTSPLLDPLCEASGSPCRAKRSGGSTGRRPSTRSARRARMTRLRRSPRRGRLPATTRAAMRRTRCVWVDSHLVVDRLLAASGPSEVAAPSNRRSRARRRRHPAGCPSTQAPIPDSLRIGEVREGVRRGRVTERRDTVGEASIGHRGGPSGACGTRRTKIGVLLTDPQRADDVLLAVLVRVDVVERRSEVALRVEVDRPADPLVVDVLPRANGPDRGRKIEIGVRPSGDGGTRWICFTMSDPEESAANAARMQISAPSKLFSSSVCRSFVPGEVVNSL